MKKICSHGGETTQRFAKGRALTLVGRRLWLHPVGPYGITADSYSHVTVEQQRDAADRTGPTTGADNEDQADDDTTLLIGSWRFAGMGWLTTGDAALANASAARARDEPIAGMIEPPEGPVGMRSDSDQLHAELERAGRQADHYARVTAHEPLSLADLRPLSPAPRVFRATRPRPHPMTSPILVGGTAVKGERSESRSDAEGALYGRHGNQTLRLG